ncbi:MAG: peptidoglycan-binding domain-containing protein [Thermoleophilia bacterium]
MPPSPLPSPTRSRRTRATAAAVLALSLGGLAAACGGDDGGGSTDAGETDSFLTDTVDGSIPATSTGDVAVVPAPPSPAEPEPAAPSAGTIAPGETMREGDSGERVAQLQTALAALGYDPGSADGNYGARTAAAVGAFQREKGLEADGIAGSATITAINEALGGGRG